MVNIIARGIQHALLVPERHRSKTQRDCVGVQWLVGSWHPRRARLGLIEAGGGLPLTASALCTHPRRARLGLIEADAFVSRPMPARHIRGARASASLKRAFLKLTVTPLAPHPRRARLGLIEAPLPASRSPAASLHPRRARLGLIEATQLPRRALLPRSHPRRARLGLIEALVNSVLSISRSMASEARAPRPH